MPTDFPGDLDVYVDKVDNVDDVMAAHINDPQDAIEAIEAKLGVDASAVATAIDYFLKHAAGAYRTHIHDGTSDDGAKLPKIDPAQSWGKNLVKNSPGQIPVDGALPQWWLASANCTFTDEDAAGEGIPDITERVYKAVTTQNDEYGYQVFTFVDEELLDAGQTVVSISMKVLCSQASKASIGLYGTNLGLQESAQHSGGGAWETLTVEAKTLNAADASIQLRCIVDTGTAYFTMPTLTVGPESRIWEPRSIGFVPVTKVAVLDLVNTGDVAWSDLDLTAQTHNLCTGAQLELLSYEDNGTLGSSIDVSHSNDIVTDKVVASAYVTVSGVKWFVASADMILLDDNQNLRYRIEEKDADSDMDARINLCGYWRWA